MEHGGFIIAGRAARSDFLTIRDFFSKFGHPVIDFLEDDPNDEFSAFQLTEELVTATALISTSRSTPGARELDLARMCWLPLILKKQPLSSIGLFVTDSAFRERIVKDTIPGLERFWLGKDSYFSKLGKDVLESIRNKFNPVILHPAIRRTISHKNSSFSLYD